jgi:hypothetical protein
MLYFCGNQLALLVDTVLERDNGMRTCTAHDCRGLRWLLFRATAAPERTVWVCAPMSARALYCVRNGRADIRDAICHTTTGMVEIVTVAGTESVPDSCVVCARIPEALLPPPGHRVRPRHAAIRNQADRALLPLSSSSPSRAKARTVPLAKIWSVIDQQEGDLFTRRPAVGRIGGRTHLT